MVYKTQGTCSQLISFELENGKIKILSEEEAAAQEALEAQAAAEAAAKALEEAPAEENEEAPAEEAAEESEE